MDTSNDFDLGPLTWVKGEIDNALEIAKRQVESWNGNDLSPLKTAETHLHQVYGALQIVDLQGVSQVCEAAERLLVEMEAKADIRDAASARIVIDAIQAMHRYLDELVAGSGPAQLSLAPNYRALLIRRGESEPSPGELFYPDLEIRATRLSPEPALDEMHRQRLLREARRGFQRGLVRWLTRKGPDSGIREMRDALREVEQAVQGQAQYTFWWAAVGLLDALENGQIQADYWLKRLLGRLDLQLKRLMDGSRPLAERVLRDVLYFQADLSGGMGRAAEVSSLFDLRRHLPGTQPERNADAHLRPTLKAMRDALEVAKENWLRYAAGKADALVSLQQALTTCRAQADLLGNPAMKELAETMAQVCHPLAGIPEAMQNESLHLELAATLLFAQNALEHFATLGDEFAAQATLQCRRLRAALDPRQSLDALPSLPLLDEFSRQAQEKLLLAQVTQEIQNNLRQVESILDAFFRNRAERRALPLVPGLMNQVLGALSMMQLDVASDLVRMGADQIARLSEPDREIGQDELDWVADMVSSLGLYVEALSHGRDDQASLRSLLAGPGVRHSEEASVEAEVRESTADVKDKIEQWATGSETDAESIKHDLAKISQDAELIGDSALQEQADTALRMIESDASPEAVQAAFEGAEPASPAPSPEAERLAAAGTEEVDAELLEIYIAEAHEVLDAITGHLGTLGTSPSDQDAFTSIRRGFHTLKGSGRMVGLTAPAEVAWEVEQTLNFWLREGRIPSLAVIEFIRKAALAFREWVKQLESQGFAQVAADELVAEARVLRGEPETPDASEVSASVAPEIKAPEHLTAEAVASAPAEPHASELESAAPEAVEPRVEIETPPEPEEALTRIGGHSLPTALYEIFIAEARQRLDELGHNWDHLTRAASPSAWEAFARSAHTLAGISRTTGFDPLAEAAHALELWANEWGHASAGADDAGAVPTRVMAELRRMYQGILDGVYPEGASEHTLMLPPVPSPAQPEMPSPESPHAEELVPAPVEVAPSHAKIASTADVTSTVDASSRSDELDAELLPIFLVETEELLPRIGENLRAWRAHPDDPAPRLALQRALHTLKGSARMAGAMTIGDETHRVESYLLEQGEGSPDPAFLESLEHDYDRLADHVDRLKPHREAPADQPPHADNHAEHIGQPVPAHTGEDESRFRTAFKGRSIALDTLINETGEVSIARSRIENVLAGYKQTAEELIVNVERLRDQLRELELQAETQMRAHLATVDDSHFDPLEFDRYTRLQELTRLMAESVNDVGTAQESLLNNLSEAETALALQTKMTRSLQQHLMHVRMVPINSQAERLHRIIRQAAKETGHKARLHIDGGATELDRIVLDKVFAPLEHLLRNAVAHGIESPEQRKALGKPEYGDVRLAAKAEGNEVVLVLGDDGAGVDLDRVRQRAEALGWIKPGETVDRERLEGMLFLPGLSTAREVTQVAGRGIGLDVVKSEIAAMGGRVRLEAELGKGTRVVIRLPLTLAIAQVVLAKAGSQVYALPAILIVLVREVRQDDWAALVAAGSAEFEGQRYPLRSLAQLTGQEPAPVEGRYRTVLLMRAGDERVALRVDALQGNAEVVVKNIGSQLARIAGMAGATVLGDGRVALILNPFGLMEHVAPAMAIPTEAPLQEKQAPLILVVDDSLTVRKITTRLLTRQGYRVATAKDGAEALEALQDEMPGLMLLDIEMPRMDGFEVTRHVRANSQTRALPIIMITSRTAEKHREHAFELGVNTFMGKPYQDDALLHEIDTLLNRTSTPTPVTSN